MAAAAATLAIVWVVIAILKFDLGATDRMIRVAGRHIQFAATPYNFATYWSCHIGAPNE